MENNDNNKFEVVEGDGSGINMSPVENYIVPIQHKKKKSKKLIVPEVKSIKK